MDSMNSHVIHNKIEFNTTNYGHLSLSYDMKRKKGDHHTDKDEIEIKDNCPPIVKDRNRITNDLAKNLQHPTQGESVVRVIYTKRIIPSLQLKVCWIYDYLAESKLQCKGA